MFEIVLQIDIWLNENHLIFKVSEEYEWHALLVRCPELVFSDNKYLDAT